MNAELKPVRPSRLEVLKRALDEGTMRQVHRAGEKIFTDYSGKKPSIVNRITGEAIPVAKPVTTLPFAWSSTLIQPPQ